MQAVVEGLLWGSLYAVISVGLTLIFGVAEIVNFAHGAFLAGAMYLAYYLNVRLGFGPLEALPVCAAALFLFGIATHKILVRRILGTFFAQIVATFGLLTFLTGVYQFAFGANYQSVNSNWFKASFDLSGFYLSRGLTVTALVAVLLTAVLYWLVRYTRLGLQIRAVSENRQAAGLVGVNSDKVFMLVWGLGSAAVGAAGAMLASFYYVFPTVGSQFGLLAFVIVALAGFGSLEGSFWTALIVGLVQTLGALYVAPAFQYGVVFIVFFVLLAIRPQGLFRKV